MTDHTFWDRLAPRYAQQPIANPDAYETTLLRVKTHLSETDSVLEIGCGTGSTALILAPFVDRYEGTDLSQGMIDIAMDKAWGSGTPGLSFRRAGVTPEEHADAAPTVCLAFNLLHLVPDIDAALDMVHDLLPEGGLFISKTPALSEKWYYRPVIAAMRLVGKAPFVRCLAMNELDQKISDAGFEIVETGVYPFPSRFIVARKR